ncbi:MAG: TRAP transporter substrate-binding protein [Spirochaetales bacterium]|nr:TRAP transporter substrate-binding protein [Spirochaetales bacterium]
MFHLNHFMPAVHPIQVNIIEPFAKDVYEKTEGRVEIVIHPGNALAAPPDTYDAVVSGVAGMGFVLPAYTPGRFPMTQTLEYPFMFTSAYQANMTAKAITPMLREYEYTDTHLIWVGGTDLGHILLKKDIKKLDDLAGTKLRSPGPIYNDVIEKLNAVEVSLPVSDLYDAMDRGIVDGTVMAPSALISFRLMEVTNQIVKMNMYTTPLIWFANKELWNKVSPEDQQIITDLADSFAERIGKQYDGEVEHAMTAAKEAGKDIYELPAEDMARFHAMVEPMIKGWIADLEEAGKPGQKIYDLAVETAKKYK